MKNMHIMNKNIDMFFQNVTSKLVLQRLHESGITLPFYFMAQSECFEHWKHPNEANQPKEYAKKDLGVIKIMSDVIGHHINKEDSILELGCNVGTNLNYLHNIGYKNLTGIEINENAISEMKKYYPELNANIMIGQIEEELKKLENNSFDLVYSMAVLMHIHPESHNIFKEISRISKKYICTVESENTFCWWCYPRNYKRVFEKFGFEEINYISGISKKKSYTLRLFKKKYL